MAAHRPQTYLFLLTQGVSKFILGEIEECHRAIHGTYQDTQPVQSPERDSCKKPTWDSEPEIVVHHMTGPSECSENTVRDARNLRLSSVAWAYRQAKRDDNHSFWCPLGLGTSAKNCLPTKFSKCFQFPFYKS